MSEDDDRSGLGTRIADHLSFYLRLLAPHIMFRLAFVGPMLGSNSGQVSTMGEILANLFSSVGHSVVLTSRRRQRCLRLTDIARTLFNQRNCVDIQVLQVYGGLSFIAEDMASWIGRKLGQKIIMHIHGGAMPEFMARYPKWSCRVLRRADAIVAPSPFLTRTLEKHGFQARTIPNVIELALYPFRWRKTLNPHLFWMRTFHPIYNPEMAVRVLARVRNILPDASLSIAGQDKGQESVTRRLADELGVRNALRLPGYLNTAAKVAEGCAADIFLNTNHVDNTPVSVLEACAMGLPVVSTKVGGIPDLLTDEETALLVSDDDDEEMATAVLRLIKEPALAAKLSKNGRQLAENCSWDRVRPQWENIFSEVLTHKHH